MSDSTIRASLKTMLSAIAGIGMVNDYDRLIRDSAQLAAAFKTDPSDPNIPLYGWEITRDGILKVERVSTKVKATYNYVIKGYYAVNDAAASEKLFQAVIDSVIQKFIDQDVPDTEGHPLPTVSKIVPYMFAGYLCHYAEVRIQLAEIVDHTAITDPDAIKVLLTAYLQPLDKLRSWEPNAAYALGERVVPNPANGHRYACTVAGISGAAAPVWPVNAAGTIADNTITWTEDGAELIGQASITIAQ